MRKKILYILYFMLFLFAFIEVGSRISQHPLGYAFKFDNFPEIDNLIVYDTFTTDSNGIYTFNYKAIDSFWKLTESSLHEEKSCIYSIESLNQLYSEMNAIHEDLQSLESSSDLIFHKAIIDSILYSKDTGYVEALNRYVLSPINQNGFKSIPFNHPDTNKKKILLIGDSFAYGLAASPITEGFGDLLLSMGYIVYNTGITGTDPAQYMAIANKYIPELDPDIVILCFFYGNDLMLYPRNPSASEPHEHFTNAGLLQSAPIGKYLSPEESYKFYSSLNKIPKTSFLNRLTYKSSALSFLSPLLIMLNIIDHSNFRNYYWAEYFTPQKTRAEHSKSYLSAINNLCLKNEVELINIVIPNKPEAFGRNQTKQKILNICFDSNPYFEPNFFDKNHYKEDDIHFNNLGHLMFAKYIDSLIQQSPSEESIGVHY